MQMMNVVKSRRGGIKRCLRWVKLVTIVSSALVLATACGSSGSGSPAKSHGGGQLVVGSAFPLSSLDPHESISATDPTMYWAVYDSLFSFNPATQTAEPWLVTTWSFSANRLTLTLHLRTGVKFTDGEAFNAQAVKLNLDDVLSGSPKVTIADEIPMVKSVDVVNDYTVELHLSTPSSALPLILSQRTGMMMAPAQLKKIQAGQQNVTPIGTGPFIVQKYVPGSYIQYTRNPNYWQAGEPKASSLLIRFINNEQAMLAAVESGEVDVAVGLPADVLPQLKSQKSLDVAAKPIPFYYRVYLNNTQGPIANIDVRKAMNYAIDRQAMMQAVLGKGVGEVAWMPVPSSSFAYTASEANQYPYNPAMAKKLMASVNGGKPIKLDMTLGNDPVSQQIGQILKSDWAAVGIDVTLVPGEIIPQSELFIAKKYPMLMSGWGGRIDPSLSYDGMFSSTSVLNPGPIPSISGTLDTAIAKAAAAEGTTAQASAYAAVNKIIVSNALEIPLFFNVGVWAWKKSVTGVQFSTTNTIKLNDVAARN
jgi:ABC-type transport system substrate-binding protein